MARFLTALGDGNWPGREAAAALFDAAAEAALAEAGARPGLTAFWRPRLARIGGFVLAEEARTRRDGRIRRTATEIAGRITLAGAGDEAVTLRARADRIDVLADGTLGILDYKTGTPPTGPKIAGGDAPQLPLEAAMAARGGFPGLDAAATTALLYWKLSGGAEPGEVIDAGNLLARHRKAASAADGDRRRGGGRLPGGPPAGRRLPAGQQALPRLAAPLPRHRRARLRPFVAPRRMGRRRGRRRRMTAPVARVVAERAQRIASDPGLSAWVGASAGSGKTKVLTDRVLRLLLREGQAANRLLCLTFTRAAAAEMATRLARRLGDWAVAEEPKLDAELAALGAVPGEALRRRARRLFAEVLELPGGMRISTIHAFCQSLLHAFPLEAGLPPQFSVLEDMDAAQMLAEARESVLSGGQVAPAQVALLAGLVGADDFSKSVAALMRDRARLATALRATNGLPGLRLRISAATIFEKSSAPTRPASSAICRRGLVIAGQHRLPRIGQQLRGVHFLQHAELRRQAGFQGKACSSDWQKAWMVEIPSRRAVPAPGRRARGRGAAAPRPVHAEAGRSASSSALPRRPIAEAAGQPRRHLRRRRLGEGEAEDARLAGWPRSAAGAARGRSAPWSCPTRRRLPPRPSIRGRRRCAAPVRPAAARSGVQPSAASSAPAHSARRDRCWYSSPAGPAGCGQARKAAEPSRKRRPAFRHSPGVLSLASSPRPGGDLVPVGADGAQLARLRAAVSRQ